jgi:hypothetical protein
MSTASIISAWVCFRAVFWVLVALGVPAGASAAMHEVMVYSFVTVAGGKIGVPTVQRPARCQLIQTDVREVGPVADEAETMDSIAMRRSVEGALRVSAFQVESGDSSPADLIVVYHWGCAAPATAGGSNKTAEILNLDAMLAVIGGRVLDHALGMERGVILAAAREERYFVIVSAYAAGPARTLLWRTHMTVPSVRLTLARAMPVLLGAGGALLARETRGVRQIAVSVSGILNLEAAGR